MLKEVEIERGSFVNFSQNLLRKSNLLGSIWGHLGQSWGQLMVCTHATCLSTRSLFLSCLIPIVPLLNTNLAFFIGCDFSLPYFGFCHRVFFSPEVTVLASHF